MIYPEVARSIQDNDYAEVQGLMQRLNVLFTVLSVVSCVGYAIVGRTLLSLAFGNAFVVIYWELFVYLLAICMGLFTLTIVPRMWSLGLHKAVLWLNATATVSQVAVAVSLIASIKLYSLAIGLAIYNVLVLYVGRLMIRREVHRRPELGTV